MSFNFNGMMQGLGAGLVNYGEILKEQDKNKWEEQKELLKYERDERLKKLELTANKENTQLQVDASKYSADAQSNASAAQTAATKEGNQLDFKLGQDRLKVDQQNADSNTANAEAARSLNTAQIALTNAQAKNYEATAAGTALGTKQTEELDAAIKAYAATKYPDDPNMQAIFTYQIKSGKTQDSKPLDADIVTEAMKEATVLVDGIKENSPEWKRAKAAIQKKTGVEPGPAEIKSSMISAATTAKIQQIEAAMKGSQTGVLGGAGGKAATQPTDSKTAGKYEEGLDDQKMLAGFKTKDVVAISEMRDKIYASGDRDAILALERNAKAVGWDLTKQPTPEETKAAKSVVSEPAVIDPEKPLAGKPGVAAWKSAGNSESGKTPIGLGGTASSVSASQVLSTPSGSTSGTIGLSDANLEQTAAEKASLKIRSKNKNKPMSQWDEREKQLFVIYKAQELEKLRGGK